MKEIWKDIPMFNGRYEASNYGKIRRKKDGKHLIGSLTKKGYLRVSLCINKKYKCYKIHRLIAITFLDNKENKKEINHKNGIKIDNRVENLEWSTRSENMQHAHLTGLINRKGKPNPNAVRQMAIARQKKIRLVILGETYKEYDSIKIASQETGVDKKTLGQYLKGISKNKIYKWEYV